MSDLGAWPTRADEPSPARARPVERERGAVLVEFAIAAPLLLLLVFAVIDFGNVYSQLLGLRNGTQSAARSAAVANFGADTSCTAQGGTWTGTSLPLLCRTKSRVSIADKANIRVKIALPDPGGFATGNTMILCTQYPAASMSGLYRPLFSDRFLQTVSVVRVEQPGGLVAAQEDALAGSTWDFCT